MEGKENTQLAKSCYIAPGMEGGGGREEGRERGKEERKGGRKGREGEGGREGKGGRQLVAVPFHLLRMELEKKLQSVNFM